MFSQTSEKVQGSDFVPRSGIFSSDMADLQNTDPQKSNDPKTGEIFSQLWIIVFSVKSCVTCCLVSMLWKQVLFRILKICSLIQNLFILFPCLCWQMHLETEPTEIEPQLIKAQLVRHFKTSSLRLTSRSSANAEVADDLREIGKT